MNCWRWRIACWSSTRARSSARCLHPKPPPSVLACSCPGTLRSSPHEPSIHRRTTWTRPVVAEIAHPDRLGHRRHDNRCGIPGDHRQRLGRGLSEDGRCGVWLRTWLRRDAGIGHAAHPDRCRRRYRLQDAGLEHRWRRAADLRCHPCCRRRDLAVRVNSASHRNRRRGHRWCDRRGLLGFVGRRSEGLPRDERR